MTRFRSADKMTKSWNPLGEESTIQRQGKFHRNFFRAVSATFSFNVSVIISLILYCASSFISASPPSLFTIIVDFHPLSSSCCRLGCLLIFWMISLLSFGFPYRSSVHPNPIEERYGKAMIWSSKTRGMQQRISIGLYICRVKCSCAVCSELHPSSCMQQHIFRGLWICRAFASHKKHCCTITVTRWHSTTLKM